MSVITVDEASSYLRMNLSSPALDPDLLQGVIDTAEGVVSNIVGPLATSTMVTVIQGGPTFVLPSWPVSTVSSITNSHGVITTDGITVTRSGVAVASGLPHGRYTIAYVAGWATVPAAIRTAILEMIRHLWQPQRGSVTRGGEPSSQPPGYMIPNRVRELLDPYRMVSMA